MTPNQYSYLDDYKKLRRYNDRLHRLIESGEFYSQSYSDRRKLVRRVIKLYRRLLILFGPRRLKPVLLTITAALAVTGALGLTMPAAAQDQSSSGGVSGQLPSFAAPVMKPFGLTEAAPAGTFYTGFAIADLDSDGDFDILATGYEVYGDYDSPVAIIFFENTGTPMDPSFSPRKANPFGLKAVYETVEQPFLFWGAPVFGDLDNDGDMDGVGAAIQGYNMGIVFIENNGSKNSPAFGKPEFGAFNLQVPENLVPLPAIIDMDADGDLDVYIQESEGYEFQFAENIGTKNAPDFSAPVENPFGIDFFDRVLVTLDMADLDRDRDPDVIFPSRDESGYENTILFMENTGTSASPNFSASKPRNLNVILSEDFIVHTRMVDIDDDGDLDIIGISYLYSDYDSYLPLAWTFIENRGYSE